jgi:uncharacterized membrane protein YhhN
VLPYVLWTSAWVATLLYAEASERPTLARIAKPAASFGFCAAALASADLARDYDRLVLAALVLSMIGDVLLLSRASWAFLGGLGSFLVAHAAFAAAFAVHGVAPVVVGFGLVAFGLVALLVWRWLAPWVPGHMRAPVIAYVVVITLMVSLAAGATAAGGSPRMLAGAFAFYLSDLSVARDRFVREALVNRAWGLPLYYAAQLCLAATI